MYAQITITAKYDSEELRRALTSHIGASAMSAVEALRRAGFGAKGEAIAPTVVAAQGLRDAVTILYFFDGPETIFIHIFATRMTNLKTQAERVTRELWPVLKSSKRTALAYLFVQEAGEEDVRISRGERVSLLRKVVQVVAEKWLSRLVVPAIVFALTAYRLSETSAAQSAGIGVLAALVGLLIEISLFIFQARDWVWKEVL